AFYILAAGWFAIAMLVTTLHFYQVSILKAQGVSADIAARVFPVSALTMVATMPLVGRMLDRFRTRRVFAAGLVVTASALVGVTLVRDVLTAVPYAMLFGLNNAFSMTLFGYLWPRYFGRRHLGSIQGTGQMVGVVGASLGPLPVGFAFDLLRSPPGTARPLRLVTAPHRRHRHRSAPGERRAAAAGRPRDTVLELPRPGREPVRAGNR